MNQFTAYDVTMSETHHIHKMDAPSGTAITLAEGILENLDRKDKWVEGTFQAPDGTVSGSTECAANELSISSIREGEVPASTASATTPKPTVSLSPTMPRIAGDLPWELSLLPNIPPSTKVLWE